MELIPLKRADAVAVEAKNFILSVPHFLQSGLKATPLNLQLVKRLVDTFSEGWLDAFKKSFGE